MSVRLTKSGTYCSLISLAVESYFVFVSKNPTASS